jgi:hypothetical protein
VQKGVRSQTTNFSFLEGGSRSGLRPSGEMAGVEDLEWLQEEGGLGSRGPS